MKKFLVYGQAVATVNVTYVVDADNEEDAQKKASELFDKGEFGAISYADDNESAVDFVPMYAYETEED